MGQFFLVSTALAAFAVMIGLGTIANNEAEKVSLEQVETAYVESDIGDPAQISLSSGSALSAAAFGLSALQPETYNREIVLDIINASPLATVDKRILAENLIAAEVGEADLPSVLTDVRIALAIE